MFKYTLALALSVSSIYAHLEVINKTKDIIEVRDVDALKKERVMQLGQGAAHTYHTTKTMYIRSMKQNAKPSAWKSVNITRLPLENNNVTIEVRPGMLWGFNLVVLKSPSRTHLLHRDMEEVKEKVTANAQRAKETIKEKATRLKNTMNEKANQAKHELQENVK